LLFTNTLEYSPTMQQTQTIAPGATTRGFAAIRSAETPAQQGNLDYSELVGNIRANFHTRKSYSYEFRVKELNNLRRGIVERQNDVLEACRQDLRKPAMEAFQAEIGLVVGEIDYVLANLKEWMEPVSTALPLLLQPGTNTINKQPKGVALIIGAWNYPIQLSLIPFISAMSAGCAAVLKPSEMTPSCAKLLQQIIEQYLDADLYRVVQGGPAETTALLKQKWNHIFYTGNGAVGRLVAKAAAENLSSCTLELGGKSPVYVAEDANIRVAARRVLGGKLFNNGQTCVAPDYVTVHASIRDQFVNELKQNIKEWLGQDPRQSDSLARIVNERHFDRISALLKENHGGKIVEGGLEKSDRSDKYIPPTLVLDPRADSGLLHEEIFGPVLPIITVNGMDDALNFINSKDSSLASYVFTENTATADKFIKMTNSGGTAVNDCVMHIATPYLPFGGHSGGGSGIGSYHGFYGFQEFTHMRGTYTHSTWMDPSNRYPPYKTQDLAAVKMYFLGTGIPPAVFTGLKVLGASAVAGLILRSRI